MSANVRITQEPDHRRRLDLAFVHGLAAEEGLYFGIMNDIFCLETFEEEDVHDVWLGPTRRRSPTSRACR